MGSVQPKGYGSTHKLRLRWESLHLKSVGEADTFHPHESNNLALAQNRTSHLPPRKAFSAFLRLRHRAAFSLSHTSRQAASGLRFSLAVLFKGEAPLAGLPLLKKCPPDTFSIHPFRAPPYKGDFAACGLRPRGAAPGPRQPLAQGWTVRFLIPWRMITTLLLNGHFSYLPRFTQCAIEKPKQSLPPPLRGGQGELLVHTKPRWVGELGAGVHACLNIYSLSALILSSS